MNKKETLNDEEMIFIASIRGHNIDSYNKRKGTDKYRVRINDREREMLNNQRSMQEHIINLKIDKSKYPKILIFDIETSPMASYTWGRWKQNISLDQTISEWFMLSWSAKWLNNPNMMSDVLTPEEALREDDSRITKSMWQLFNEADIVLAHNACVQRDTPILMQDLTWKKAGDLVDGDKVFLTGYVNSDGSVLQTSSKFGFTFSSSRVATGRYSVTVSKSPNNPLNSNNYTQIIVPYNPVYNTFSGLKTVNNASFVVYTNSDNAPVDSAFKFILIANEYLDLRNQTYL